MGDTFLRGQSLLGLPLSAREAQVAGLLAQAKSNKEIAYEMHLSTGTIKEYVHKIFAKLGFTNRTEVALWVVGSKR